MIRILIATMLLPIVVFATPTISEAQETADEAPATPAEVTEPAAVPVAPLPAEPQGYEATLRLTNGSVLRGTVVAEDLVSLEIRLSVDQAVPFYVAKADIESIVMGDEPPELLTPPTPPPADAPTGPELMEGTPILPSDAGRLIGFGLNFGVGFGHKYTTNAMPGADNLDAHFDIELPGFELRLYPEESFSIDFLFKIGNATYLQSWLGSDYGWYYGDTLYEFFLMTMYFHIHSPKQDTPDGAVAFGVAPGIVFGGGTYLGQPLGGQVGFSIRVGPEFSSPDGVVDMGIYFRPGAFVAMYEGDDEGMPGVEGMFEFTWTWNLPRPPDA